MGWNEMVNNKNLSDVRDYLKTHKEEIINEYKASGVGIGKSNSQDDNYVIVVYLDDHKLQPEQPVIKNGITLKFEITGPFVLHT
jgi:hypothetical protein